MKISSALFEAFLKCPTKCFLLSVGETKTGNVYAEWQQVHSDSYRSEGIKCLMVEPSRDESVVVLNGGDKLKTANWRLVADVVASAQEFESAIHMVERFPPEGRSRSNQLIPIQLNSRNKLSRDDKLLLAFDAFVLSKQIGCDVRIGKIIHGDDRIIMKVNTSALTNEVQKLIGRITAVLSSNSAPELILNRHCSACEFQARCRQMATEKDELSLLGGMTKKERKKLNAKGIFTVTQLSYTFRPRRRPKRMRDRPELYRHSLKALAVREHKIHIIGNPELKVLGTPVYLDVESLPDRDFYYLIGMRVEMDGLVVQHSFWADSAEDESKIWGAFLDTLATINNPVLIHYGSFETNFFKHMSQRYGELDKESLTARSIENAINVLSFIFEGVYFPTYTNGLKDLARYLKFDWSEPNATGLHTVAWRTDWERSRDQFLKEKLVTYNAQDCEALHHVTDCLRKCRKLNGTEPDDDAIDVVNADVPTHETSFKFGKNRFALVELDEINRAAYWDYQRERILLRSGSRGIRSNAVVTTKRAGRKFQINRTVQLPIPQQCPRCGGAKIYKHRAQHQDTSDVRFGRTGIKRWTVRYSFYRYRCPACHAVFQCPDWSSVGGKPGKEGGIPSIPVSAGRLPAIDTFGHNLKALSIYLTIDLGVPQARVAAFLNAVFGFSFSRQNVNKFKASLATLYKPTYEALLEKIVRGRLVHSDETRVNLSSNDGYVWVFTNLEEVVYVYAQSREGELLAKTLKEFKGVLVSDFYAAYGMLDCPQQRCLIHLVRDMNNDLLKEPFNEELKSLVAEFAKLLRPMIATIDRFGLKTRFLRKHKTDVNRFFEHLSTQSYLSETATKCKVRLEKNRSCLFTFLDYDMVPWNNNNAEHAVKAFAMLRDTLNGLTTEKGLADYLVLLSICETCKFKGVEFLEFLLSGDTDVDVFAERKSRKRRGDGPRPSSATEGANC